MASIIQRVQARLKLSRIIVLAAVAVVTYAAITTTQPQPRAAANPPLPIPMHSLGLFADSGNLEGIHAFEQRFLNGQQVPVILEHVDYRNWTGMESPWFLYQLRTQRPNYRLVVTAATITPDSTFAAAANGDYDEHWRRELGALVSDGYPDAILRVGHEMNCCFPWNATRDPQGYINMFRHFVSVARTIPGQRFLFDWNPIFGGGDIDADLVYPGDDVVDIVGPDVYDTTVVGNDPVTRWNKILNVEYGLNWYRDFAKSHGKLLSIPEWGLTQMPRIPSRSGGDNPYFVQQMKKWIDDNDVLFADYFDDDNVDVESSLMSGRFPNAANTFRSLFGAGIPQLQATTTVPATTATTAAAPLIVRTANVSHEALPVPAATTTTAAVTTTTTVVAATTTTTVATPPKKRNSVGGKARMVGPPATALAGLGVAAHQAAKRHHHKRFFFF